ncbi:hypothetical protein [Marinoscillum pacificum]|uniref:hypothetical protein n=1 Tax=Marinoscillum pacificum TaxID=392723 RepID=UPI002158482A|nr:hypothetical protein [Marinoscillum pacificum]
MNNNMLKTKLAQESIIPYFIWFLIPVGIVLAFYQPFQQPILFDRAYLLFMSQVVERGDKLYTSTTFGYTPLSTLFIGFVMKFGRFFQLNTIESARIFGIFFYGIISVNFYRLCLTVFDNKHVINLTTISFIGLDYFGILSSVNAEPKLWVLLFTILGLKSFIQSRWFLVGLYFSLGAMCWHVDVLSLIACGITLLITFKSKLKNLLKVFAGTLAGTLPVLLYLSVTGQWTDFWNQAVLRKLTIEGEELGESIFIWIQKGIYPAYLTESLHFIIGLIGVIILMTVLFITRKKAAVMKFRQTDGLFIVIYCSIWALFNSLEFQSNVDLIPLIPVVIIGMGIVYSILIQSDKNSKTTPIAYCLIVAYNFYNLIGLNLPFTFQDQLQTYRKLNEQYGNGLSIGTTNYYAVTESKNPSKLTNFLPYEEAFLGDELLCQAIQNSLIQNNITYIIELDRSKRNRSEAQENLIQLIGKGKKTPHSRTDCAETLINNKTAVDSITIKLQAIYFLDNYYINESFMIYDITN